MRFGVWCGLLSTGTFFFVPSAFADQITAAPVVASTDDLIGVTNTRWEFTATNRKLNENSEEI